MIDVSRLSRREPKCHPNEWPTADYNAFVTLLSIMKERDSDNPIGDMQFACKVVGLSVNHWLPDAILSGVFERFYQKSSDVYFDAKGWLASATNMDREVIGPKTLAWLERSAAEAA